MPQPEVMEELMVYGWVGRGVGVGVEFGLDLDHRVFRGRAVWGFVCQYRVCFTADRK